MIDFADPTDVLRERESRRSRMVRAIRGWLRRERHPRWWTAAALAASAMVAIGFWTVLGYAGIAAAGLRAAVCTLAAWPVFIGLIRWYAARESRCLVLGGQAELYIAHDDMETRESLVKNEFSSEFHRAFHEARDSAAKEKSMEMLLLAFLSLGVWTLWVLVRYGATLIAETMVDAEIVPVRRDLLVKVQQLDWRMEAFGATALHFGVLTFIAGMIGWMLPYLAL